MAIRFDKYQLYEASVQAPEDHFGLFGQFINELGDGKPYRKLREDFCGTAILAKAWAELHPLNASIGVDLDIEPLRYARAKHLAKAPKLVRDRVMLVQRDVTEVHTPGTDLICAGNFSFYVFHQRHQLLKYFRAAYKSLRKNGLLCLEMAGGPGFTERAVEKRPVREPGLPRFSYVWRQKTFDPVTAFGSYAIEFDFKKRGYAKDVFQYDWRIWTIPEVREALIDAGFRDAHVYWEGDYRGQGNGKYRRVEKGTHDHAWVAYLVGRK